jgi:hypothetical protein
MEKFNEVVEVKSSDVFIQAHSEDENRRLLAQRDITEEQYVSGDKKMLKIAKNRKAKQISWYVDVNNNLVYHI